MECTVIIPVIEPNSLLTRDKLKLMTSSIKNYFNLFIF